MHQNASKFDKIAKCSNCQSSFRCSNNTRKRNDTELTTKYCFSPSSSHCFLALQSSPKKRTKMRKKRRKKNWDPQRCKNRYIMVHQASFRASQWPTYKTRSETKVNSSVQQQVTHHNPLQRNCSLSHSHILNASKPVASLASMLVPIRDAWHWYRSQKKSSATCLMFQDSGDRNTTAQPICSRCSLSSL